MNQKDVHSPREESELGPIGGLTDFMTAGVPVYMSEMAAIELQREMEERLAPSPDDLSELEPISPEKARIMLLMRDTRERLS